MKKSKFTEEQIANALRPGRQRAPEPYLHAAVIGGVAIQFVAASLPGVSKMLGHSTGVVGRCFRGAGVARGD